MVLKTCPDADIMSLLDMHRIQWQWILTVHPVMLDYEGCMKEVCDGQNVP